MARHTREEITGTFHQFIYSPHGSLEGVLLEIEGQPVQVVLDKDDDANAHALEGLLGEEEIVAEVKKMKPSDKGPAEHTVYELVELVAIAGATPAKTPQARAHRGRVVRFNYARHGEANGFILDSGDFIHTAPKGFKKLKVKVGDVIEAEGEITALFDGRGLVVEAEVVRKPKK